ncbi:cyclic nucleotide-binding domain-containing protein [Streptomyces sp. NBC_01381]|uniref:Crp/Fnr family transcriptional regulator n=1 Tax=Streptomyces sp. NBC_01381 TaxID=2903845 RepID=UPI002250B373|nr:cyclic nucleotide-binding domain-containing protein [Streptomyces sp. NBC_01381]MCX4673719.1 cyclic nucleotide-binding domain-containing protein [Streptomyces sp. NBC_01381]
MTSTTTLLSTLPVAHRERLMRIAREVSFPAGTRIFEEGGHADRFWIVRTGSVVLDMHVPGRSSPAIETLGHGELVGWSWLFPPYVWQLGAVAQSPVRAHEFDALAVRLMCEDDQALGAVVGQWVGRVLAHRLQSARTRLLDLYAPYGSGSGVRG